MSLGFRLLAAAGSAQLDLSPQVERFELSAALGELDSLSVSFADPALLLAHVLQEGLELQLELEVGGRRVADSQAMVFTGKVYEVRSSFGASQGEVEVEVVAYGPAMALGLRERSRLHRAATLSALLEDVAREIFAEVVVDLGDDPPLSPNGTRQIGETDLAFLLRICAARNVELVLEVGPLGPTLRACSHARLLAQEPAANLAWGRVGAKRPLSQFEANADAARRAPTEVFAGAEPADGRDAGPVSVPPLEGLSVTDVLADEALAESLRRRPEAVRAIDALAGALPAAQSSFFAALAGYERRADGEFRRLAELRGQGALARGLTSHGMEATGELPGDPAVRPGRIVHVAGVGARFSGLWLIRSVAHRFADSELHTQFEAVR